MRWVWEVGDFESKHVRWDDTWLKMDEKHGGAAMDEQDQELIWQESASVQVC